jgi:hypothetical protein
VRNFLFTRLFYTYTQDHAYVYPKGFRQSACVSIYVAANISAAIIHIYMYVHVYMRQFFIQDHADVYCVIYVAGNISAAIIHIYMYVHVYMRQFFIQDHAYVYCVIYVDRNMSAAIIHACLHVHPLIFAWMHTCTRMHEYTHNIYIHMPIYIYIYIYIYMNIYIIYTYIYTYIYIRQVHTYTYLHTFIHRHIHAWIYTYIRIYANVQECQRKHNIQIWAENSNSEFCRYISQSCVWERAKPELLVCICILLVCICILLHDLYKHALYSSFIYVCL